MCILTASGDLTTGGYGTSARFGGGWGWSLPHAFLTDTLFSTEILCDCPLPACFKPTAILRYNYQIRDPTLSVKLSSILTQKFVLFEEGGRGRQRAWLWRKRTEP